VTDAEGISDGKADRYIRCKCSNSVITVLLQIYWPKSCCKFGMILPFPVKVT
jgi:hypothetical protein